MWPSLAVTIAKTSSSGVVLFKKGNKKKYRLVPKVVIDLPFEGRKVEGSQKHKRRERVPNAGSRREETFMHWRVLHNSCGQMLPAMWNMAKPLEVEYRRPIHRNGDQGNSGRKEIEKPPCREEIEGQESRSRRDHQSSG